MTNGYFDNFVELTNPESAWPCFSISSWAKQRSAASSCLLESSEKRWTFRNPDGIIIKSQYSSTFKWRRSDKTVPQNSQVEAACSVKSHAIISKYLFHSRNCGLHFRNSYFCTQCDCTNSPINLSNESISPTWAAAWIIEEIGPEETFVEEERLAQTKTFESSVY